MLGLYVHIPYCEGKCFYCDFYSAGGSHAVPDAYVDALLREMHTFSPCAPLRPDTLYFGGGTPSLLTPAQVCRVIDAAAPVPEAEITLEANPGTVTRETLGAFRSAGVNRLSLGVQTASDESLRRLGRRHTAAEARQAFAWAAEAGFTSISGDVMLALPSYTSAELADTLQLLAEGGCTHISSYLLKIEPHTVFGAKPPLNLPGDDAAADFYLEAVQRLSELGFAQYEISNFARPGFESRHNLLYWNLEDYLGLGPAAHSCTNGQRFFCPPGTAQFLEKPAVYTPDGVVSSEDFLLLQLRLCKGLSLTALREAWGISFTPQQMGFLQRACAAGLAKLEDDTLRLTPRGMLVQNSILCELL